MCSRSPRKGRALGRGRGAYKFNAYGIQCSCLRTLMHSCKYMEILNWVKEWGSYCLNWNKKVTDIMHHCQISIPKLEMGDGSYPQNKQIYFMLERNFERLHMEGYKNLPSFD